MFTNRVKLDIKDTGFLHIVRIFQHPTSHRTTSSSKTTMVNASKQKILLHPVGKYGMSTKHSTQ
jgi:hypothetical protein